MTSMPATIGIIVAALLLAASGATAQDAAPPDYRIVDGQLEVFGHRLDPVHPIPREPLPVEYWSLGLYPSPDNRWVVIRTGYGAEAEIWLYDSRTNEAPLRLEYRAGRGYTIRWYGSEVFDVLTGGMGYRRSDLRRTDDPTRKNQIDDMLHYEATRDVYVRYVEEGGRMGVVVGRAFAEPPPPLEFFPLYLHTLRPLDRRVAIDDVEISGRRLVVRHRGASAPRVFAPDLLR